MTWTGIRWKRKGSGGRLCDRALDVFPGQPSSVSELPFSRDTWRTITQSFRVHRTITRTILREVTYFSVLRHTPSDTKLPQISYTARMNAALPCDLALSTTYIPSTHTSYSVLYGVYPAQGDEIWARLFSALSSSPTHPLLVLGIFLELDRARLISHADSLADEFTLGADVLSSEETPWDPSTAKENLKMQRYLRVCLRSRTLADYMGTAKRQLSKVLAELDELELLWTTTPTAAAAAPVPAGDDEDYLNDKRRDSNDKGKEEEDDLIATGKQMKQRIRDIMDEYDDRMDECGRMAQNLSLAMQTGWNQIARQDSMTGARVAKVNTAIALETKRESAQMRSIAVLTMVYLPFSCVASVFSTSLFNWSPDEGEPVVSHYIWILMAIAAVLTVLTVLAWYLWTTREEKKGRKGKSGMGLGMRNDDDVADMA
ncbi:hypothetical protein B0H66DRAFT_215041 [Apodospora peruviana]|uniref:Uncharacterized protein n=1 Tax=Apodospora peruviana TaxID=516989 RepID=A0AAE0M8U6_9PEZI|nr:hypothetical protein B0H66DRAFT_215041 [Apodospora peruviana]